MSFQQGFYSTSAATSRTIYTSHGIQDAWFPIFLDIIKVNITKIKYAGDEQSHPRQTPADQTYSICRIFYFLKHIFPFALWRFYETYIKRIKNNGQANAYRSIWNIPYGLRHIFYHQ